MGPKAGASKHKPKEEARDETLQAVLADSYERRFAPFTLERPRCLLPLANTPLIEYTLEFLANAGVEDIFIYCGAHTDQLEAYINSSKWHRSSSPFKTLTLLKSTATSVGDAMRDLDHRDLITGDFLFITGDVLSNISMEPILARHRARREKDKNAIMTMILREAGKGHRTKRKGRQPVFVVDPATERCIHYAELRRHAQTSQSVDIEAAFLDGKSIDHHAQLAVRADLIDCNIDICTPDVLSLWSDNFDYQSARRSFLHGVLKDYELNNKAIHAHVLGTAYAARVRSLRAYAAISKDVVSRWTYPLCPDSNLLPSQTYAAARGNVYQEDGVMLARGATLRRRTVVGAQTSVGDASVVGDSTVGRRCQIGRNVTIEGSYIWDDVAVGDGAVIRQAVVANEAVIGAKCVVEAGALISYGVRVADGTRIPGSARITNAAAKLVAMDGEEEGEGGPLPPPAADAELVGHSGSGHAYASDSDASSASLASARLVDASSSSSSAPLTSSRSASISSLGSLAASSSDVSSSTFTPASHLRHDSMLSAGSSADDPTGTGTSASANRDFRLEATASVYDGLLHGDDASVISLELLSQRMAANADDHAVRAALVQAFMKRLFLLVAPPAPAPAEEEDDIIAPEPLSASEATARTFGRYHALLSKLAVMDRDKEEKRDQVDLLVGIQRECVGKAKGEQVLVFVVHALHAEEVVQEEGVLSWWNDRRSKEGGMEGVRGLVGRFVEGLEGGSESESESEGEDEGEDEEEDDGDDDDDR